MSDPLVSVIVPVYKVERQLERCLDSIVQQTYRPLEVIVVDDGSPDGCGEIMRRYEQQHPFLHTITQRHRGLGPARNAALSVAHGVYVAMIDSDDWIEPDYLTRLVGLAEQHQADVAVCNFSFDAWGLRVRFPFLPRVNHLTGPEAARWSLNMSRFPAFAWNKLYRRELFHPDDPPFPTIFYEDMATTPRILRRARTVVLTREVLYHYCLRSDSITGSFGVKNVFSFAAAVDILRRYLWEEGLWEGWRRDYQRLLRTAAVMMGIQVTLQRNGIPLTVRGPVLSRFLRSLGTMREAPQDGHRLRVVELHGAAPRPSFARAVVSAALVVARPGFGRRRGSGRKSRPPFGVAPQDGRPPAASAESKKEYTWQP